MNKKGALELSFGMIFSIILIAVFIAFAFFGIKSFLAVSEQVKYVGFVEDLQTDINNIYQSAQASNLVSYLLPSKITQICFENSGKRNLIFNTKDPDNHDFDVATINNLDLISMFPDELSPPICLPVKDGNVSMRLSKGYGSNLVIISEK